MKAFQPKAPRIGQDSAEWKARVDLAAAHRLAAKANYHSGIANHLTLAVPGKPDRYLQIPYGLHWLEVTASCFMEVDMNTGEILSGEGDVERSTFCIHAPMHRLKPEAAACVMHTHMLYCTTLTRLKNQHFLPIGQNELQFVNSVAYDEDYQGFAHDPAEGVRLTEILGDKTSLMMANHGVVTIGKTVAEAYNRLYYIERAAQLQVYAYWTGQPLRHISPEMVDFTIGQQVVPARYNGKSGAENHFEALKRLLINPETDFRD